MPLCAAGASAQPASAPPAPKALGREPDNEQRLVLRGVTGVEEVQAITIEHLRAGAIVLEDQLLPVIASRVFANADGILGVDGFKDMCLHADFARNRVSINADGCPRLRRGRGRSSCPPRFGRQDTMSRVTR